MAVTGGGTPYVESSDLVANYPAASLSLANKVDTKLDNAPTDNAQSGTTYTFVLADARQLVSATNASAKTFTIPPQSSVTWLTGTMIRVVNYGAGALTIDGGVGVTVTNTASTLAQYQAATAIRTGSNAWTLVPFTGGAASASVSGTTGSPTITTVNGKSLYKYTGSGSITISSAGRVSIVVQAGGGGGRQSGNGSGGGGGGSLIATSKATVSVYLPVGTYTVNVGAGGAQGVNGADSYFGSYYAGGGGGGSTSGATGGGSLTVTPNQPTTVGGQQGKAGGAGDGATAAGGGGGVLVAGTNGASSTGGNGGAGVSDTIEGSSVTRGGGGGGWGATTGGTGGAGGGGAGSTTAGASGTVNSGGGGGGGGSVNALGLGGSGVVLIWLG